MTCTQIRQGTQGLLALLLVGATSAPAAITIDGVADRKVYADRVAFTVRSEVETTRDAPWFRAVPPLSATIMLVRLPTLYPRGDDSTFVAHSRSGCQHLCNS